MSAQDLALLHRHVTVDSLVRNQVYLLVAVFVIDVESHVPAFGQEFPAAR